MTDWQELADWMRQPEVQAAVARQSEPQDNEIPFELIEVGGRAYTLPEPEEPEQLAMEGI